MDNLGLQMQLETQKQWIETLSQRLLVLTARVEELEHDSAPEAPPCIYVNWYGDRSASHPTEAEARTHVVGGATRIAVKYQEVIDD